jgi:DNA-directed RNA polymerase specialized sigma24 family protein
MTLSDALVAMAPSDRTLSPEEVARRDDATAMVYEALVRLARRMVPLDLRSVVAQDVLIRLSKNRPGPRRYTSSDGEAEAYLKTALGNRVTDLHRRAQKDRKRWESPTVDEDDRSPAEKFVDRTTPEDLVMADEHEALIGEAMTRLFEDAIPEIAGGLQNPGGFLENIGDLRAIASDDLTVDAIVAREGGQADTYVKVRNRVYQRHKRARAYLLEVPANRPAGVPRLTDWLRRSALAPELEHEIRRLATEVFAPRVDRSDGHAPQEQDS